MLVSTKYTKTYDLLAVKDKYKDLFFSCTQINSSIISTVDHVYASPPIRLIDSHARLSKLNDVKIIVWDITIPFEKKHRYELILDSGLFSSKNKDFYYFDLDKYYFQSKLYNVDLVEQKKELEYVLNKILPSEEKQKYLARFDNLIEIYTKASIKSTNAIEFYRNLVEELYSLINLVEQGEFFYENSVSLFYSGILENYLPQIIRETLAEDFSLINLLEKTSIFKPPYFRPLSPDVDLNLGNKNEVISNLDSIVKLLQDKKIIPSNQIILWSLQLAGIKHFGNDFNFHNAMHLALNDFSVENDINTLQVTQPKEDGSNFIEFAEVKSYHIQQLSDKKRIVKTPTKKSRVNDIPNLYLHLGDKLHDYWDNYNKTASMKTILMGEVI
jgi:hypothetical protein